MKVTNFCTFSTYFWPRLAGGRTLPDHVNTGLNISNGYKSLPFVHSSEIEYERSKNIRFRRHGIFKTDFFPQVPLEEDFRLKMLEFFEVLVTKICIFDNRIQQRLRIEQKERDTAGLHQDPYRKMLLEKLELAVFEEKISENKASTAALYNSWTEQLSESEFNFMKNCHFLVMHLSFIEKILNKNEEERDVNVREIRFFIDHHIIPLVGERPNFFLVITTGRGRTEWWNNLSKDSEEDKNYARFVLFRPIESLLSVVENSVNLQDDIELKYRIAKVLYGN